MGASQFPEQRYWVRGDDRGCHAGRDGAVRPYGPARAGVLGSADRGRCELRAVAVPALSDAAQVDRDLLTDGHKMSLLLLLGVTHDRNSGRHDPDGGENRECGVTRQEVHHAEWIRTSHASVAGKRAVTSLSQSITPLCVAAAHVPLGPGPRADRPPP